MANNKQIELRAQAIIDRLQKAAPFVLWFLRRLGDDIKINDEKWQDCLDENTLMKLRIGKKAATLARDKFYAAAKDQARKEMDNEKKANIDNRAS